MRQNFPHYGVRALQGQVTEEDTLRDLEGAVRKALFMIYYESNAEGCGRKDWTGCTERTKLLFGLSLACL